MMKKYLFILSASINLVLMVSMTLPIKEDGNREPRIQHQRNDTHINESQQSNNCDFEDEIGFVQLNRAELEIQLLALWWKYLVPRKFRYEDDSIFFEGIPVDTTTTLNLGNGRNLNIDSLFDVYTRGSEQTYFNSLYPENLATSYSISKQDIAQALGEGDDRVGIRVYEALKVSDEAISRLESGDAGFFFNSLPDASSHVYVVPVMRDSCLDGFFVNNSTDSRVVTDPQETAFGLDLTLPCPNTCDNRSPLRTAFTSIYSLQE